MPTESLKNQLLEEELEIYRKVSSWAFVEGYWIGKGGIEGRSIPREELVRLFNIWWLEMRERLVNG